MRAGSPLDRGMRNLALADYVDDGRVVSTVAGVVDMAAAPALAERVGGS